MKFEDFFPDSLDYPSDAIMDNEFMLVPGYLYCYIANTFLNGLINYVKPLKAFIIDRYSIDNDDRKVVLNLRINNEWGDYDFPNKESALAFLDSNHDYEIYHTNLNMFRDDVLFLGETEKYYWHFWFDCDSSDCSVGRFEKTADQETVIALFTRYCVEHSENKIHEFKLDWIKGWISW
jgi:hypothetical protein